MELIDRWSDKHRKEPYLSLRYQKPKKPTDVEFPPNLALGPEQLEAINSNAQINLLIGEAGSGKTTVLLAILFKHTGKHLKHRDLRNVIFIIPKQKVAFTKYVAGFIKKHCIPECVYLRYFTDLPEVGKKSYHEMLKIQKKNTSENASLQTGLKFQRKTFQDETVKDVKSFFVRYF